jgi:serine/threonine-protein kinase
MRTEKMRRPSQESVAESERKLLQALREATLGEYEVLEEVGRGGMAVVFLAHDISLDRKVAIKMMSPALTLMDPDIQERFKREARTAASLSHPHIIPVYSVRDSDHIAYFVMKFIEGRTLESVMREVGALPVPVVQTILNQAGSALGYAHRKGVVHRDVKPGNILLDPEGWVVVTDFGIAKVAQAEALTMTGGMVGTPTYMSPEQCGGTDVTGAVDQYALGVVAYEMLTGRQPFKSETVVNLLYDHCHTPPPPLQDLAPDCPPEVAAAVMRMLEKKPEDRWPSIEEAVEAVGVVTDSKGGTVRTHMMTLARAGSAHSLLEKFRTPPAAVKSTPATPVTPPPDTSHPVAAAAGRSAATRALWAAPILAAAAVGVWLVLGRGGPESGAANAHAPSAVAAVPQVALLEVAPPHLALDQGSSAPLAATPRDAGGSAVPGAAVTWISSNPGVASVSEAGVVTAFSSGTATITARSAGSSASITVTVTEPPPRVAAGPARVTPVVTSVGISPPRAATEVGSSVRLGASAYDQRGSSMAGRSFTWSSSDPRVAQVSADGLVTGIAEGTAEITASNGGRSGTATVDVSARPVASVALSPGRGELQVGTTLQLSATARDDRGATLPGSEFSWRSSDPGVATVSRSGLVTAVAPGAATVTAASGGASADAPVVVTAPPAAVPERAEADPRVEIESLIENYRRAIESRDLSELRRAYPGMTFEQERAWRDFFGNVSELTADLRIIEMEPSDDAMRARVEATYRYRMNRSQTQTFVFTATFRRTAQGWQLSSVQ